MQLNVIWLEPSEDNWKVIDLVGLSTSESIVEEGRKGSSRGNTPKKEKRPYAYAFYATTSAYACGAFVQVAQLRDLGTPASIDFVL
ncbi:unnamed protein product, partial [Cylindrotheca closterium]